ncbi:MAG: DNA repair protein RecN, partial [Actinobacteria bacterium]|nr:DNA repair protein RecN [Actinomycetota bacterium]
MLHELRVENLLLIEHAEVQLAPGLNVLTGETGAGKTVLAHALDLLLGGKARPGIVRPGAQEAYVEGVFDLPQELRELLGDRLSPDAEELVLARRVSAEGRTRALISGRSATAADLREIAELLLSFYGQHEHRRLTLASAQLELLDAFCGPEQAVRRTACSAAHAQVRAAERRLEELDGLAGARERELDLLAFEMAEIDDAAPDAQEEAELLTTRERLRHLEALRAAAWGCAEAMAPDEGAGVAALLGAGGTRLDGVAGVDPRLDAITQRWAALAYEADDLAAELRRYAEGLESDPATLDALEERLALLERLKRKHGGSIEAVLAHADRCRTRHAELEGAEVALEEAKAHHGEALAARAAACEQLRAARAQAAPRMGAAVAEALDELAMAGARFEILLEPRDPGPSGADAAEFLLAPNAGVPPAPIRDAASGGELSRVMLALLGVAGDGSRTTLVFDEVDAGIGGQTARAVGARLQSLAAERQVICITHLPQIASLGDRHFSIAKDAS